MKKKLIFALSTAVLSAGLSFGVSYEAEANGSICNGRTEINGDNMLECKRIGQGCKRACGFLELG
jgi:hypothetical protein